MQANSYFSTETQHTYRPTVPEIQYKGSEPRLLSSTEGSC